MGNLPRLHCTARRRQRRVAVVCRERDRPVEALAGEILRAANAGTERCPALALFAADAIEDVRCNMGFVAIGTPVQLKFSADCLRLTDDLAKGEVALERVQLLCAKAQQDGGARCEFDLRAASNQSNEAPHRGMVRAMLRAPSMRGPMRLEFQPRLLLTDTLCAWLPDWSFDFAEATI